MNWLNYLAIALCGFNAITGILAWFGDDPILGKPWGPKWYLPFGWVPMSLFVGFNVAVLRL